MQTKTIKVNSTVFKDSELKDAVDLLKKGEVVAFPTETVYGLGANTFDEKAVSAIFAAKNRPADNPLIVHICSKAQLKDVAANVPKKAQLLMEAFWPGPLTIVLKKNSKIPSNVTAGLDTVAIRMPSHKVALSLIKECGFPIAAPSANFATKPSPTTAQHVLEDLNGRIPLVIDSGVTQTGLESTVIKITGKQAIILRPGTVTLEQIQEVIGKVELHGKEKVVSNNAIPLAPGMKYKHYSPNTDLFLFIPKQGKDFSNIIYEQFKDKEVGIISFTKKIGVPNEHYFNKDLDEYARQLFSALRELDNKGVKLILVEGVEEKGVGLAIMNRLKKAALKTI